MAKQSGIVKFRGALDDILFTKTQDGYLAQKKTDVDKARIASDDSFRNTRKNMAEFGRAGKAAMLFREAFRSQLLQVQDNRVMSRLLKQMLTVVKSDTTPDRGWGSRLAEDGNITLLEGFHCNINASLGTVMHVPYSPSFDRNSGKLVVDLPGFNPKPDIEAPGGATDFRIFSAAAEFDFANNKFVVANAETPLTPWTNTSQQPVSLVNQLTPASVLPVIAVVGILFYKIVNGVPDTLNTEAAEAMSVVKVYMP